MRLDTSRPYEKLGPSSDPEYVRQDGVILCWSESNMGYETAWWLTAAGDPVDSREHIQNLMRDRPFDKAWIA